MRSVAGMCLTLICFGAFAAIHVSDYVLAQDEPKRGDHPQA
jgi:hypothetical protein